MATPQVFAARADEHVALAIEREVVAREDAVCLSGAAEHRNVRLDPTLHQPRQIAAGTIGGVRRQPLGAMAEAGRGRSIIVRAAATSAVQRAGEGSTSTMIAALVPIR